MDRPIASVLVDALILLCFLPGFTIAPQEKFDHDEENAEVPLECSWSSGVCASSVHYHTYYYDANRTSVLDCLLSSLSSPIYSDPSDLERIRTESWLGYLCASESRVLNGFRRIFFVSILNIVLEYNPVGWGIPYNHIIYHDMRGKLVVTALQVLNVILEYESILRIEKLRYDAGASERSSVHDQGAKDQKAGSIDGSGRDTGRGGSSDFEMNQFFKFLNEMKDCDYEVIFSSLVRLTSIPLNGSYKILPNSKKSFDLHQELVTLFWLLVRVDNDFLRCILGQSCFLDIIYEIVCYIDGYRKDGSQMGLVYLGIYLLSFLSGEREFSIALNTPFRRKLQIDIPRFSGCYSDYLILFLIQLMHDGHQKLEALWELILNIINNVSPYVKSLSVVTSNQLLKLFISFSRFSLILSKDTNRRYIFLLLETLSNILQYQYEGNVHIAYEIISYKDHFYKLWSLVRPEFLSEILNDTPSGECHAVLDPSLRSIISSLSTEEKLSIQEWARKLPLSVVHKFLEGIMGQINKLVTGLASDQDNIIKFLKNTTLVGLLPVPHVIVIRHYRETRESELWFLRFMWEGIFLKRLSSNFESTRPRLFSPKFPHNE